MPGKGNLIVQVRAHGRTARPAAALSSPVVVPHRGVGETVAKIILFGEHSVVYGYPAIAMPLLNLRMRARVEPTGGPSTLRCLDWSGRLEETPERFASTVRAVRAALDFVGDPDGRFRITIEADFPPERGLGSSAAAAGAVIRAILDAHDVSASDQELFELTQNAERVAHGRPSGLDATATASSVPVWFQAGETHAVEINLAAWIIVADSGIHGSTRETVGHVRAEYERSPRTIGRRLAALGRIAESSAEDVRIGDVEALGAKMNEAHAHLAELGVSNDRLDALVEAARSAGAIGAKLTGGGRGGCVIALAATSADADRITRAFGLAGAPNTWVYAPHAYEVAA